MQGKLSEAEQTCRALISLTPTNSEAHVSLGNILLAVGKTNDAAVSFRAAAQLDPDLPGRRKTIASSLADKGEIEGAIANFTIAVLLNPSDAETHGKLGLLLAQNGRLDDAITHFREATTLRPDAENYHNLGLALLVKGRVQEAVENYRQALQLRPDWETALNDLAWLLATSSDGTIRNGQEAISLAQRACDLSGGKQARYWGTLDAAYAEAGKFEDAIRTAEKAREMAKAAGEGEIVAAADQRLAAYRKGQPYRQ
jgi:Flp pilus assembly protein TadD